MGAITAAFTDPDLPTKKGGGRMFKSVRLMRFGLLFLFFGSALWCFADIYQIIVLMGQFFTKDYQGAAPSQGKYWLKISTAMLLYKYSNFIPLIFAFIFASFLTLIGDNIKRTALLLIIGIIFFSILIALIESIYQPPSLLRSFSSP